MTKKRRKSKKPTKKSSNSKVLIYIAWGLALLALLLVSLMTGYYLGFSSAKEADKKEILKEKQERLVLLKKVEKSVATKPIDVNKALQELLKKESMQTTTHSDVKIIKPQSHYKKSVHHLKKPRLAIILDDVCSKYEVNTIKSLRLPITMSFFPPTPSRPNTPELAEKEQVYMVHLPMQAMHWSREQPDTLHVGDSKEVIFHRVAVIKKLFPRVHYINNHTGSKFTADATSMYWLISALNRYNINFIDSRTTAQTKAPLVMKKFGKKYVARDVFLDNRMDVPDVVRQIKVAIEKAKKHGSAIVIGHPHKSTLEALRESKRLLKDVDLVYINALYK